MYSMTRLPLLITIFSLAAVVQTHADDSARIRELFASAERAGGTVTIPPGDYSLDGNDPIPLRSHTTVIAYGARFALPEKLGDKARVVLFAGEDVHDFRWFGGHFEGHVFDPSKAENSWEPNANTRAILLTTTLGGRTENLTFRDISSDGLAGAVVTVLGMEKKDNDREIETYARNVSVENCTFERSGKFMWDYGYLWHITVWPEDFNQAERDMAAKYFRNDLIQGPVRMTSGSDRVYFDNKNPLPVTALRPGQRSDRGHKATCFFGDELPSNLVRGRQYNVVESTPQYIKISETIGGPPVTFVGDSGHKTKLISDLSFAFPALYVPTGSGPGKGALDLVGCQQVTVRGCRLSALGDTMHIQKSQGVVFTGNQITGSRMGAFFLAEFCKNAVICGNTIDGTNGSRVMSVEKSCEDVTITGNTFRNGGRGSWINQPRNFVLSDNIFVNNTTKCERDPRRGRRTFLTGDYEQYAELYFTTYQPDGRYGNVTVRGNIFISGDHASHAITFAPGGDTLTVEGNLFKGAVRTISVADDCKTVTIRANTGTEDRVNASGLILQAPATR